MNENNLTYSSLHRKKIRLNININKKPTVHNYLSIYLNSKITRTAEAS